MPMRTLARGCPSAGSVRDPEALILGCGQALDRAYAVANFLRTGQALQAPSPWYTSTGALTTAAQQATDGKKGQRSDLKWIAVSGEDDSAHRPVNVPSSPSPQYEVDVDVETPLSRGASTTRVHARYVGAPYPPTPPSQCVAQEHPRPRSVWREKQIERRTSNSRTGAKEVLQSACEARYAVRP